MCAIRLIGPECFPTNPKTQQGKRMHRLSIPVVLVLVVIFFAATSVYTARNVHTATNNKGRSYDELSFLRSFYKSTNGHYWKNNTGWNKADDDDDYCRWHGIKCLHDAVFYLQLPNNNLTGTLPTGIRHLRSLWIFNVGLNNLYGTIPDEYGELQSLTGIILTGNDFSGTLPDALCSVPTCQAFNNPRLKCPPSNCRNNHCNMLACNCGGQVMCNDDYDCAGKLCTKCKSVGGSPWYKICQ